MTWMRAADALQWKDDAGSLTWCYLICSAHRKPVDFLSPFQPICSRFLSCRPIERRISCWSSRSGTAVHWKRSHWKQWPGSSYCWQYLSVLSSGSVIVIITSYRSIPLIGKRSKILLIRFVIFTCFFQICRTNVNVIQFWESAWRRCSPVKGTWAVKDRGCGENVRGNSLV